MDRYDPTDTVHEMRQLRLRAVLAEQREADLKAALENAKGERDWWRTIADRRLLPVQRAESSLARSETREWWWRLTG